MDRAVSPVVGVALVVALTVTTAAAVTTVALAVETPAAPPQASLSLSASAESDRLALTHEGGEALDVRELRLVVRVGGDPLDR